MPKSWTWGTEVQRSSRWERDRKRSSSWTVWCTVEALLSKQFKFHSLFCGSGARNVGVGLCALPSPKATTSQRRRRTGHAEVSRRDSKAHDRRKRVGTSKAATAKQIRRENQLPQFSLKHFRGGWHLVLGLHFFRAAYWTFPLWGHFADPASVVSSMTWHGDKLRRLSQDYDIASHWACATGKSGDVVNEDARLVSQFVWFECLFHHLFVFLPTCEKFNRSYKENEKRLGHNGHLLEYLRWRLVLCFVFLFAEGK